MTVYDRTPEISNLAPALLDALRRAAQDAARFEVQILVNSGWRSRAEQQQLFREAVTRYGSTREAARWVAPPEKSAHVAGEAVDIAPAQAAAWLSRFGARYGLCQTYRNEPWHFEFRRSAARSGCPPLYADPTHDPSLK